MAAHSRAGMYALPYPADGTLCEGCQTEMWWDRLQDNVMRVELRHANDCEAESASRAEELVLAW
jgi:hypothetical protein